MKNKNYLLSYLFLFIFCIPICAIGSVKQDEFTFAIIADPQLNAKGSKVASAQFAEETLRKACDEINQMNPQPKFTLFLGDLVNVFENRSVQNFRETIRHLNTKIILAHGNHDTPSPFHRFISLNKEYGNGNEAHFSFDVEGWHFVVLPCDFILSEEVHKWLENDLKINKNKPTVVFEHFHLIPLGLSQLEFYTFEHNERKRLLNTLARYGNVKYYFNGHVHNGIKSSVKMSKTYKGIQFITVPTIIQTRPFGEEFLPFSQKSECGGFYMIAEAKKEQLTLFGRQAGVEYVHQYPSVLESYDDSIERRWLQTIGNLNSEKKFYNGNFEDGLKHWNVKYRYIADSVPAFDCKIEQERGKENILRLSTRSLPPEKWANDEYLEAYQIVKIRDTKTLSIQFDYNIDQYNNGGGFLRLTMFDKSDKPYIVFFHWGEHEENVSYLPRCIGGELSGKPESWNFLRTLGENKEGFYIRIPSATKQWQTIGFNIHEIIDKSLKKDVFSKLGVKKIMVSLGTWANKEDGAYSRVSFDNIRLSETPLSKTFSEIDYEHIYDTSFGLALDNRVIERERNKKNKKK